MESSGVGFNPTMSAEEQAMLNMQVNAYNKSLETNGRAPSQSLGKDDFLKLLITQLSNQDPTDPMDNTQFIAQMAQFSSLEQMTNMNKSMESMNAMLTSNSAIETLGKTVDIDVGSTTLTGTVSSVTAGSNPQVMVNGMYFDMNRIMSVYGN